MTDKATQAGIILGWISAAVDQCADWRVENKQYLRGPNVSRMHTSIGLKSDGISVRLNFEGDACRFAKKAAKILKEQYLADQAGFLDVNPNNLRQVMTVNLRCHPYDDDKEEFGKTIPWIETWAEAFEVVREKLVDNAALETEKEDMPNLEHSFHVGETYNRQVDIHGKFGGQRQGGISTPSERPYIFLFAGTTGDPFGYSDGWTDDGVFLYSGEGQVGDMVFKSGNLAIQGHAAKSKDLLLFEALGKRKPVRYLGQFLCAGWHNERGPDRNGDDRETIIFHLIPFQNVSLSPTSIDEVDEAESLEVVSLVELRRRALEAASPAPKEKTSEGRRNIYQRSKDVSRYVLARANGICECCEASAPFNRLKDGTPYLEPHHILRMSDGGPDHPRSIAGICPNCHREIHSGKNGKAINEELAAKIRQIENGR